MRNPRELRFELVQTETAVFEEMVKRTFEPLGHRAERLCAGDYALAQECVHYALIKAASDDHWPTLRSLVPFQQEGWIIKTMTRKALDEFRRRARDPERAAGELPEITFDRTYQPAGEPSRDADMLDRQQAYREAREALGRTLAAKHKGPYKVLLMDLADYTDREIAEVMGIKLVTVRSYRSRGHMIMRREHGPLLASWRTPTVDRK